MRNPDYFEQWYDSEMETFQFLDISKDDLKSVWKAGWEAASKIIRSEIGRLHGLADRLDDLLENM